MILTVTVPVPNEGKKLSQTFIFTLLCGASKDFMKALKAIIKPFEAPRRSVKKKKINLILILMQLSEMHGTGRVKYMGKTLVAVILLFL